jgi:hypothetical protein
MANQIDNDSKIISARVEGFGSPSIVRVTGGRIYVAHIIDSGELEVHYSDTNGASWTLDETFTEASNIDMPCIVAYSDTDIALAYSFSTDTNVYTIKVKVRDNGAGTWSEVYNATSLDSNYIIKPNLTVNKNLTSRLHLMFITNDGSTIDIRHDKTDDKGSSWAGITTKNLATGSTSSYYYRNYSLDSDPSSGDLYFFYHYSLGIFYIDRFNSSGTYQSTISVSAGSFIGGCGVVTSENRKWLVTLTSGYLRIWETLLTSGTLSTSSLNISSIGVLSGNICCGVDGNDNLYVFYTKSADEKTYSRKYNADSAAWEDEVTLTSGDGLRVSCEQHILPGTEFIHYIFYSD